MSNLLIDSLIEAADSMIAQCEQAEDKEMKQKYIDFLIGVWHVATSAKWKTKNKQTRQKMDEIKKAIDEKIKEWTTQ